MAKIVPLIKKEETLEDLLKKANLLSKTLEENKQIVEKIGNVRRYFEAVLAKELLRRGIVSRKYFLCAIYVSGLMEKFVYSSPRHLYVVDYLLEEDLKEKSKDGADFCFLLCTFFPDRTEKRAMKKTDYQDFGQNMYWRYFRETDVEVACFMSELFVDISEVSSVCFSSFKNPLS